MFEQTLSEYSYACQRSVFARMLCVLLALPYDDGRIPFGLCLNEQWEQGQAYEIVILLSDDLRRSPKSNTLISVFYGF